MPSSGAHTQPQRACGCGSTRQCRPATAREEGCRDHLARLDEASALPMHITDLTHFLDAAGGLAPVKGPARALAQFLVDVVAHASDGSGDAPAAPKCFKCKKGAITATRAMDHAVVWTCPACGAEGRISNWQGTLWDLTARPSKQG